MKKVITVVMEVDKKLPQWLLDSHLNKEIVYGVRVLRFETGDMIEIACDLAKELDDGAMPYDVGY